MPWVAAVLDDLRTSSAPGCRAFVSTVRAGERIVAAHLGLRGERVAAWWFPTYDVDRARHSPGMLLCLRVAEGLAADGVEVLDLGKDVTTYKERLRNGDLPVAAGRVVRFGLAPVRRAQLVVTSSLLADPRLQRVRTALPLKRGRRRPSVRPSA